MVLRNEVHLCPLLQHLVQALIRGTQAGPCGVPALTCRAVEPCRCQQLRPWRNDVGLDAAVAERAVRRVPRNGGGAGRHLWGRGEGRISQASATALPWTPAAAEDELQLAGPR